MSRPAASPRTPCRSSATTPTSWPPAAPGLRCSPPGRCRKPGLGSHRPRRHPAVTRTGTALFRRIPHLARSRQDRHPRRRRPRRARRRRRDRRTPGPGGCTRTAQSIRGTSQNPDAFFQAREAANPFYDAFAGSVADTHGHVRGADRPRLPALRLPRASRGRSVLVMMGSGAECAHEVVDSRGARRAGRRVQGSSVPAVLDGAISRRAAADRPHLAVLDRTKEPGSAGEPLLLE